MSWTHAVAGAQVGNKSGQNFIELDGTYVCDIQGLKVVQSTSSAGMYFIAEMVVVETTHPTVKIGEERSWLCNLANRPALSDVLEFTMIMLERLMQRPVDQAELNDPRILEFLVSEQQPCRGIRMKLKTWGKKQRRDPSKMFTVHDWEIMDPGAVLGLVIDPHSVTPAPRAAAPIAAAPMTMPPPAQPAMVAPMAPAPMAAPHGFVPPSPVAAPPPMAPPAAPMAPALTPGPPAVPSAPPPGWPPHMPWPGQTV